MLIKVLFALLVLSIIGPFAAFYLGERKAGRLKKALAINIVSFFGVLLFTIIFVFSGSAMASAADPAAAAGASVARFTDNAVGYFSAAMVTSIATIATGLAVGKSATAALGALSENENIMGKALIFVALGEGIALYGVLISIMILARLG